MKKEETTVRAARKAKGLTLKELAAKSALSYSHVQEIDAGGLDPGPKARFLISMALGDKNFRLWPSPSRPDLRRLASLSK